MCVSGDLLCPAGCSDKRDSDCLLEIGSACGPTTASCVAGAWCQHGFCCDMPCGDSCSRCDLPGRVGRCSPLLFGGPEAPLSNPDIRFACDAHYTIDCVAGACQTSCLANYGDCDGKAQETGCETELATAEHCASCNDRCQYGYCGGTRCEWSYTSDLSLEQSAPLAAGTLYATLLVRTSEDLAVRALGALVDPSLAGSKLRLALYEANGSFLPDTLIAQTLELDVVDDKDSQIVVGRGALRVEAALPAQIPLEKDYYIAIEVLTATKVFASATTVTLRTASQNFAEFPLYFPFPSLAEDGPSLSLYAITTPH